MHLNALQSQQSPIDIHVHSLLQWSLRIEDKLGSVPVSFIRGCPLLEGEQFFTTKICSLILKMYFRREVCECTLFSHQG